MRKVYRSQRRWQEGLEPLYGRNGLITRRGGLEPRCASAMERILQAPQRLATNPWGVALIQQDLHNFIIVNQQDIRWFGAPAHG
jgi:hypothetical protein